MCLDNGDVTKDVMLFKILYEFMTSKFLTSIRL